MSLVVLENVSLFFADRQIFDSVDLRLGETDRIGLIGPNGSGKTTLLKIIAGDQHVDDGLITRAKGVRVGYLPQELVVSGGRTLVDFVLSSVPGRSQIAEDLAAAEAELEAHRGEPDDEGLMELAHRIADLHERADHFDRFFSEHEALGILAGLGFRPRDRSRDLGEFSGGWKMRAVLAALLFQRPDVLLLDEPTNHLDMPSVAWFSAFLQKYNRCFILISHDREFLNEQIDRVMSLEPEGVRIYKGNYDSYLEQRAEEEEILAGKAKNLEREREHLETFVNRFRAQANKAKAVQSRVKALAKMEDVETYQKRKVMRFTFPPIERTVGEVVKIDGLRKAFGDNVIFPGLDLTIRRGDKIGIIGVNGAGKTTLLRMIAGEMKPDSGTIRMGSNVNVGYYAQHHADTLELGATIFEVVSRANPDASVARVRSILGAFLFSGDDIDKPIKVLSGGERSRVALARLLVKPGNCLLMDEPTNHLDLVSSESLAASLADYEGTLVFVSHNRSFIRKLATKIWNVENQTVEDYPGTLDEYMYSYNLRARAEVEGELGAAPAAARTAGPAAAARTAPGTPAPAKQPAAVAANAANKKPPREDDKTRKRREADLRNRRHKVIGPLEREVQKLEERIGELETAQTGRSGELADPAVYEDAARRNRLLSDFQEGSDKLEQLNGRWEVALEALEKAKAAFAVEEAAFAAEVE